MLGVSPTSEWSETDRMLALALHEYEDLLCPCGCGFLAEDTLGDSEGLYEVDPLVCHAREAQERYMRDVEQHDAGEIVFLRRLPLTCGRRESSS